MLPYRDLQAIVSAMEEVRRITQPFQVVARDLQAIPPAFEAQLRNIRKAMDTYRVMASEVDNARRILSQYSPPAFPTRKSLEAPQGQPQKSIHDRERSEREKLIELFRLPIYLLDLPEDLEHWPPENWPFPYFGKN